jgi:hypothetical protein
MAGRAVTPIVLTVFFAIATVILVVVGLALLAPGTPFEAIWRLYPARRAMLTPYRLLMGPGFLALSLVMASAAVGCLRRRRWGWRLALAIFAINGLGDLFQLVTGHLVEGGVGTAVAGAVLIHLSRPAVRGAFA